jgi:FKBP-type peptidyl-prolyl cis-trans isomerase (trigger factor)
VRLTVDVPAHDVHHAVEHATTDLAASVKIPGFRPGKVPVPVLRQRLGPERIMAEAVDSHIGGWFWNAAARARIRPVAQPQYEYDLPTDDDADWRFHGDGAGAAEGGRRRLDDARGRQARGGGAAGGRRRGDRAAA